MISLTAKLRMYILGTVRMSLFLMIMVIRMTLPVVPNMNRNTDISNSYGLDEFGIFFSFSVSVSVSSMDV